MFNLIQIQEQLKGMPMQALVAYANGQNPEVPPYIALSELSRRKQMEKSAQPEQAQQGSIKDQVTQDVGLMNLQKQRAQQASQQSQAAASHNPSMNPDGGIDTLQGGAGMPQAQAFRSGGIVAFAEGDLIRDEEDESKLSPYERGIRRMRAQRSAEFAKEQDTEAAARPTQRGTKTSLPPAAMPAAPPPPAATAKMPAAPPAPATGAPMPRGDLGGEGKRVPEEIYSPRVGTEGRTGIAVPTPAPGEGVGLNLQGITDPAKAMAALQKYFPQAQPQGGITALPAIAAPSIPSAPTGIAAPQLGGLQEGFAEQQGIMKPFADAESAARQKQIDLLTRQQAARDKQNPDAQLRALFSGMMNSGGHGNWGSFVGGVNAMSAAQAELQKQAEQAQLGIAAQEAIGPEQAAKQAREQIKQADEARSKRYETKAHIYGYETKNAANMYGIDVDAAMRKYATDSSFQAEMARARATADSGDKVAIVEYGKQLRTELDSFTAEIKALEAGEKTRVTKDSKEKAATEMARLQKAKDGAVKALHTLQAATAGRIPGYEPPPASGITQKQAALLDKYK